MKRIIDRLRSGERFVADGAWGTELQAKGLAVGECPELWNAKRPEEVLDVARSYVAAGADLIGTNSFGANRIRLDHFGIAGRAGDLNRIAAGISKTAVGPGRFVMGSIGPTGKMLVTGEVDPDAVFEAFSEQAEALAAGGADALLIETFSDIDEALIAVRAARSSFSGPVFCTMTFEPFGDGDFRTMMGVSVEEMTERLVGGGADAVGANCGRGPDQMELLIGRIRSVDPSIPVIIQPNAGLPEYVDGKLVYSLTPESFGQAAERFFAAGAAIVGGCCGTTPEHIRRTVSAVAKR